MKYALAIDIGGTFTDAVLIRSDGTGWTDKTLTTHQDLLEGFFRAADFVLKRANIELKDVDDVVVHATTVVTNMLIERKGFRTGLIVTEGFKDVLYIRDEHRYDMFDPQIEYPEPLITRENTWGVKERIFADASVGVDIDEDSVRNIARELKENNIISVAVCLLNSYCNPVHEQEIGRILKEEVPDIFVTLSSDVAPQMREYLRASTTAVNAYAVPITRPYLNALTEKLKKFGVGNEPLIMLSNGGIIGARVAGTFPVRMIESGPAAGALVAGHIARKFGFEDLISFDMGGTTAKACMIQHGTPLVVGDFEVDRQYLFKPGSGMPVTVPSIDMIEIGAGGGSIARVDNLGLLKVGPDSAGSSPGPACYDRGGEHACVTDADVILNILDPDNFLNGDMKLDAGRSERAIQTLADKLNLSVKETAWGIFSVVGESMAAAARAHATDRGINYRGLPMLAFGGAGPVHACYVAERLDSNQVIYPPMASVLSAFGTLVTPARLDLVRGGLSKLGDLDWDVIEMTIEAMLEEGKSALMEAGIAEESIVYEFSADMRYSGQQTEVTVILDEDPRKSKNIDEYRTDFEKQYETLYSMCLGEMDVEVVNWRVTAHGGGVGREVNITLTDRVAVAKTTRGVYLENGVIDVAVFDRTSLAAGQVIVGPVIIEERETTAFILPGWTMEVHTDGSLIATKQDQGD